MTDTFEAMPNGERRFRFMDKDNSGYIRTEAAISGGWQKPHLHDSVTELYVVQKGWILLAAEERNRVLIKKYNEGDHFVVHAKVPHAVYLSKNAVTHTVKYGDCPERDWHGYDSLDCARKPVKTIKKKIASTHIAVVSFDVFDTLVCRHFFKPTDLFLLLGEDVPRKQAEEFARKKCALLFPEYDDITLDEIYEEFGVLTDFSVERINALKQKEIDLELEHCEQRSLAKELFDFARQCGKRIFITSDMYLSSAVIERILKKCGYDGYENIFVSSEQRKAKETGNLFKKLVGSCSVPPQKILHIGDNLRADVYVAKKSGLHACHLPQRWRYCEHSMPYRFLRKIYRTFVPSHKSSKTPYNRPYTKILQKYSMLADFAAKETFAKFPSYPKALVEASAFVSAPVLFSFVTWIIRRALNDNIKRLYFLARDGFILYHIAKEICASWNIEIELKYIFVSRMALRYPQYHRMGKKCVDYVCMGSAGITRKGILDRLLLNENEKEKMKELLGFREDTLSAPLTRQELHEIKEKLLSCDEGLSMIFTKSEALYETAAAYFRQEGLFDSVSYALVDSGWTGSMQIFINEMLVAHGHPPVYGFYFGLLSYISKDTKEKYYPYCFSPDDSVFISFFNNNIIECMCSAPTGTTMYYEKNDAVGIVRPVFSMDENINNKKWFVNEQIALIRLFAGNYTRLCKEKGILFDEAGIGIPTVKKLLYELTCNPSKAEATIYGTYLFSDDLMETDLKQMAPAMSKAEAVQNDLLCRIIRKFLYIRRESYATFWFYGSLRRGTNKSYTWHRVNELIYSLIKASRRIRKKGAHKAYE